MSSPEATILLKSPDGAWEKIGTGVSRGIVPEGLSLSSNEFGPDTCSFTLRREASVLWPDLTAFNQCEISIGSTLVWGGRIWEAPLSDGDEDVIAVQGRGWQYHLDDDLLDRLYVHTNLSEWRSTRGIAGVNISTAFTLAGEASTGGLPMIGWAAGTTVNNLWASGLTLDLGSAGRLAKRIVVTFEAINANAFATVTCRAHAVPDPGGGATADAFSTDFAAITSPAVGTFATSYRYITIYIQRDDGFSTPVATDHQLKLTSVKVFSATAYESGNVSVLKASQVAADVLASGAVPLLDSSTTKIGTTAFSIPELAPAGYQTPRALIAAANAYEGNLFGVDAERKLFLRERDEVPQTEVGSWPGSSFQDASTNSGESLYSRVIVQGTGPDGVPVSVSRGTADLSGANVTYVDTASVSNPSFETNTAGWTAGTGTIARSTAQAFEGTASASLTSAASKWFIAETTTSSIAGGKTYQLRISVFHPAGVSGVWEVYAGTGSTALAYLANVPLNGSGAWSTYSLSFFMPAAGAVTITVVTFTAASILSAYIDAIRIYEVQAGLVMRQGFTRTAVLSVESAITTTGAEQLGNIWLSERVNPPLKGSLGVIGWGGARNIGGGDMHPSEMLLRGGQLIRLGQLVDPSTGDQGRDGVIKAVSYAHDTETATLELDSERGRLETLLSRLAVVTSQIR